MHLSCMHVVLTMPVAPQCIHGGIYPNPHTMDDSPLGKGGGLCLNFTNLLRFQHDASTSLEIDGITKLQPFIFICFTLNHCQSVLSDHHHWWLPCLSSARLTHLRPDIAATAALNTELTRCNRLRASGGKPKSGSDQRGRIRSMSYTHHVFPSVLSCAPTRNIIVSSTGRLAYKRPLLCGVLQLCI